MNQELSYFAFRVAFSVMMFFGHGWPKFVGFSQKALLFPDPLGVGRSISLGLATFAEAVCPILIAFGLLTRLASIPLLITMGMAAFVIHAADPWGRKEMAVLYLIGFAYIFMTGSGRYSLQSIFKLSSARGSSLLTWLLR